MTFKDNWLRNLDLPALDWEADPFEKYEIPQYDACYELVWYVDPLLLKGSDQIWAVKYIPEKSKGTKDMGYLKLKNKPKIIKNPDLPDFSYDIQGTFDIFDLHYELVWNLNTGNTIVDNQIWAAKIKALDNVKGLKYMESIDPCFDLTFEINPDFSNLQIDPCALIQGTPPIDFKYELAWTIDSAYTGIKDDVVVCKIKNKNALGTKFIGVITPNFSKQLDVVFISCGESNATKNWERVLQKAPWAKRVMNVKGIFNAHQAAAHIVTTDMFYVVDGDAYLNDDWEFNYQPSIFDRDCVHIWHSQNPVNDLEYGYGGVKLFPRDLLLNSQNSSVDTATSISNKIKIIPKISNITAFNTDPFNTWRSAFRECAKLASSVIDRNVVTENNYRLHAWVNHSRDEYAVLGARAGAEFGLKNKNNLEKLKLINDHTWLKDKFDNGQ